MEIKTLNTKQELNSLNKFSFASSENFDFPVLINQMKHQSDWENGDLNAMILYKSHEKHIILAALHKGTEINSFQSNDSVSFQIIEGKINFQTKIENVIISKGQLLTLHDNVKYRLTNEEDTVFLLTTENCRINTEGVI